MDVRVTITGAEALQTALQKAGGGAQKAVGAGLYQEAETIMAKSKRIVPVLRGALKASGTVFPPVLGQLSVTMGYGGAAVPYAVYVHERTDLKHKPPTQAKYLEQPARQAVVGMADRLAARARAGLQGA